jgi:hypothetical protein
MIIGMNDGARARARRAARLIRIADDMQAEQRPVLDDDVSELRATAAALLDEPVPGDATEVAHDDELDRLWIENALLREAFRESQVVREGAMFDHVELWVPRAIWLRLRAWRASRDARPRRMATFTDDELGALSRELLDTAEDDDLRRLRSEIDAERALRRGAIQ